MNKRQLSWTRKYISNRFIISSRAFFQQKIHFKRIWRINCTSRCEKKRYLNSTNQNLDEVLKNELNHEVSQWRTSVTKNDEIEWRMKRIRLKPSDDLDGGSDEMAEEVWTLEKKRWKTLGTRIYSSRTNSKVRD